MGLVGYEQNQKVIGILLTPDREKLTGNEAVLLRVFSWNYALDEEKIELEQVLLDRLIKGEVFRKVVVPPDNSHQIELRIVLMKDSKNMIAKVNIVNVTEKKPLNGFNVKGKTTEEIAENIVTSLETQKIAG